MRDNENSSEFTVSSVLKLTWYVFWKKPIVFLGMNVLFLAIIKTLTTIIHDFIASLNLTGLAFVVVFQMADFLRVPVFAILWSAITYAVFMLIMDKRTSFLDSFINSASRILEVISGSIIMLFVLFFIVLGAPFILLILASLLSWIPIRWKDFSNVCCRA